MLPASGVQADGAWEGDEYSMWATGTTRESVALRCQPEPAAPHLGPPGRDTASASTTWCATTAIRTTPHQVLYHINTGFPLVDAGSRLLTASAVVTPRDAEARKDGQEYNLFTDPIPGYAEKVYYHDMTADGDGYVRAAIINFTLWHGEPFGLYVKYRKEQLPRFVEWKMMGEGDYVVGMEPANCGVEGRNIDREQGTAGHARARGGAPLLAGDRPHRRREEYRAFRKSLPL